MINIGAKLFNAINRLEASLAGLSKRACMVNNTLMSYYTNSIPNDTRQVVVLLHGFSAGKSIWTPFAKIIGKQYRLVIPDLLGHGDTPYFEAVNYSVPNQASHVMGLLDNLDIDDFHLIGNSMGGMIAARIIELQPLRTKSAVLIDPAGAKSEFAETMCKSKRNPFIISNREAFKQFYTNLFVSPPYVPRVVFNGVADLFIQKQTQYAHMFTDFFNINDFYAGDFTFPDCKSLVMWGQQDLILPVSDHKFWEQSLNCRSIIYSDIGHMPMVEQTGLCASDTLKFLQSD